MCWFKDKYTHKNEDIFFLDEQSQQRASWNWERVPKISITMEEKNDSIYWLNGSNERNRRRLSLASLFVFTFKTDNFTLQNTTRQINIHFFLSCSWLESANWQRKDKSNKIIANKVIQGQK